MTSKSQVGLLVGIHFNPVGRVVLKHLPGGARLLLNPEPDNPYDPLAVQVFVEPGEIPESEHEALSNPYSGTAAAGGGTFEEVMSTGPIMLGHIGRSGGKPLEKARAAWPSLANELVGNAEMMDWIKDPEHEAVLGFAPSGEPLVILRIQEEQAEVGV